MPRQVRAHADAHEPSGSDTMDVDAAAGTGSLRTLGTSATSAAAGNDSRLSDSRAPTGSAGGDLSGTYPNPALAAGVVAPAELAVVDANGAAPAFVIRVVMTAGSPGTADDVVIYNANAPFAMRILFVVPLISTGIGGSTVSLRDALGGGGNLIGAAISTPSPGQMLWNATATGTIAANGTLTAYRSDRGVAGELVLLCMKV